MNKALEGIVGKRQPAGQPVDQVQNKVLSKPVRDHVLRRGTPID